MSHRPSPALIALSALAAGAIAIAVVVVGSPPATASSGRTVTVTRGVVQSTVSGSGNLAPGNQFELNFATSGVVTNVYVKAGQHVSEGQLLAQIDDSSANVVDLRAPAPATVASVAGSVGDTVSAGTSTSSTSGASPSSSASSSGTGDSASTSTSTADSSGFITLAQLHRFKMDVSVSEADIGKVKVGQAATVTVDAVSGLKLSGHVAAIGVLSSSSSSSSSSAVSYPVTIAMDQGSRTARAGMSGSADIVVSQVSGLTVPSQAVSRSTVTLVENGKKVTTPVQTGVVGDTTTQIVSGVKRGDQVYVQSPSAAAGAAATGSASSSRQQNGLTGAGGGFRGGFGGGGFPGGGGGGGGRPGGPAAGGG